MKIIRAMWRAAAFMATVVVGSLTSQAEAMPPETGFPELSRRVPLFEPQLTSRHWEVRYSLLGELDGQDDETRRALEVLMKDPNDRVANQAQVRWLYEFIEVDRSLFRPEVYLQWPRGTPKIPKDQWRQAMLDHVLGRSIQEDLCGTCTSPGLAVLDESVMSHRVGKSPLDQVVGAPDTQVVLRDDADMANPVEVVGMLGAAEDAEVIKPFGESTNPYLAWKTAVALVRLGDRKSADAILMRIATGKRDDGNLYYVIEALDTMRRLKHPAFEETVVKVWEETTDEAKKLADGQILHSGGQTSPCWPLWRSQASCDDDERDLQAIGFGRLMARYDTNVYEGIP